MPVRAWVLYSLIRLGLFAVVFALLYLVAVPWWLAAILAAVIGFCIAYIFFRPLRDRMALELAEARERSSRRSADEVAEDGGTPER